MFSGHSSGRQHQRARYLFFFPAKTTITFSVSHRGRETSSGVERLLSFMSFPSLGSSVFAAFFSVLIVFSPQPLC